MFCNVMATFHDKLCKVIVSTELVGYGSYSLCLHDFDCVRLCMMHCCMILFAIVARQYSHIALTLHHEMFCQMCLNGPWVMSVFAFLFVFELVLSVSHIMSQCMIVIDCDD